MLTLSPRQPSAALGSPRQPSFFLCSLDLFGSRELSQCIRSRGRARSPAQASQAARSNTWSCAEAKSENTFQPIRLEMWKIYEDSEGQSSNLEPCFTQFAGHVWQTSRVARFQIDIWIHLAFLPFTSGRSIEISTAQTLMKHPDTS